MRIFSVVLLIVIGAQSVFSLGLKKESLRRARVIQITSIDTTGYDKIYAMPDEDLNDLFAEQIDSLVNSWYVQNAFVLDSTEIAECDTLNTLADSIYISRLQDMETFVDMSFNKTVKNFIALYTIKRRKQVEVMLGLANYYFPIFEEMLDKYNLPMELKYLPIIESALNPGVRSRANAVGLWQFVYGTGRMYKLEIGTFVDERCDPVKSTEAAVKYLSDLYKIYKNWHLVIAAYNCGPGNVNRAIRRSGGARDYWKIYYRLPRETRGYVPAFIAASYVMENYKLHNFTPHYPDFPIVADTMVIRDYLHFKQVSEVLNIPIEELRALNPQYRRDIIPAKKDKPYILKIPIDQVTAFIDNERDLFNHKREEYFPNNSIVTPQSRSHYVPVDVKGMDKLYYKVKSGDNLGFIAEWYKVRLSDLRYWNNIYRNLIRVNQRLVIYKPKGEAEKYANIDNMSFQQKQQFAGKNTSPTTVAAISPNGKKLDSAYEYYTVRRGDNLYYIARRYPGISSNDIIRLNGLNKSGNITPGQVLKIRKL